MIKNAKEKLMNFSQDINKNFRVGVWEIGLNEKPELHAFYSFGHLLDPVCVLTIKINASTHNRLLNCLTHSVSSHSAIAVHLRGQRFRFYQFLVQRKIIANVLQCKFRLYLARMYTCYFPILYMKMLYVKISASLSIINFCFIYCKYCICRSGFFTFSWPFGLLGSNILSESRPGCYVFY